MDVRRPESVVDVPIIGPSTAKKAVFAVNLRILGTSTAHKVLREVSAAVQSPDHHLQKRPFLKVPCNFLDHHHHLKNRKEASAAESAHLQLNDKKAASAAVALCAMCLKDTSHVATRVLRSRFRHSP